MIPVPMLAAQLAEALYWALAFAVLAGAISVRTWDALCDLLHLYWAHRRRLRRARQRLIRAAHP